MLILMKNLPYFYVNVMVIAAKILYKLKLLSQKRSIDDFGLEGP